ncbi:MAG: glycosyltransferase family 4 protein [Pseudomonadota bacterium]
MARTRIIVAPNSGEGMGGEAIKAFQHFSHLLETGAEAVLIAHVRSRPRLGALADSPKVILIEDGPAQRLLWRSRVLARGVDMVFHLAAAREIRRRFAPDDVLIHYLCPISPVALRFPPRGYDYVLGPLNGAVAYPPAFRDREGRRAALERVVAGPLQRLLGLLTGEKRRARAVLVSGGPETEASALRAGARPERIVHAVDSGVSERFFGPRVRHEGVNGRFVALGRFVDYKGFDLAIEALARTPETITLDIFGDGAERPRLEALVRRLGLETRVRFAGWLDNAGLAQRLGAYRGFVFPTLAEANGIVMQEAMAAGVPVIALNWGGPARLAGPDEAIFVEPTGHEEVVAALADAMTRLAEDPERADALSVAARMDAERRFRWSAAAAAWAEPMGDERKTAA